MVVANELVITRQDHVTEKNSILQFYRVSRFQEWYKMMVLCTLCRYLGTLG